MPKRVDKFTVKKALDAKIPVIAQAYLDVDYGDAMLTGYADLLIREDHEIVFANGKLQVSRLPGVEESGNYVPYDIKFSSKEPKYFYWYQVASYHEALQQLGIASTRDFGIINRDKIFNQPVGLGLEELRKARQPLFYQLKSHTPADAENWKDLVLNCPTPATCIEIYCEYPDLCKAERVRLDTLYQLYDNGGRGIMSKLMVNGINTVTDLSRLPETFSLPEISNEKFRNLIIESKVVLEEKNTGQPAFLQKPTSTSKLPQPSLGDLFFDLEWFTPIDTKEWLYYVFGTVNYKGEFKYFEAHNFEQERHAFASFVDYCLTMIHHHPDMHIYHWTSPEVNGLTKMADRHNLFQDDVKIIQRHMVDLKPIAVDRVWVGAGGYGLKKLERYYSKQNVDSKVNRNTDTEDGADSMVQYFKYQEALKSNETAEAAKILKDIFDYNKADCVSTLEACNWLRNFD
jgi:uncharacterized protein